MQSNIHLRVILAVVNSPRARSAGSRASGGLEHVARALRWSARQGLPLKWAKIPFSAELGNETGMSSLQQICEP